MCFLPLKPSHYPSRPVLVPELFGKYPTRPVPKSKTPTRQTLDKGSTSAKPYFAHFGQTISFSSETVQNDPYVPKKGPNGQEHLCWPFWPFFYHFETLTSLPLHYFVHYKSIVYPRVGFHGFHGKIPYSVWNVFISISSFISSLPYIWEISVQIWIQFQRRSERPLHSLQYDHSTWKDENGRNQIPSMLGLPWLLKTGNSFGCLPLWTTWPELLSWNHQCHTMSILQKKKPWSPKIYVQKPLNNFICEKRETKLCGSHLPSHTSFPKCSPPFFPDDNLQNV